MSGIAHRHSAVKNVTNSSPHLLPTRTEDIAHFGAHTELPTGSGVGRICARGRPKLKLGGTKMSLVKRGSTWHTHFFVDGQRFRQSLETSDWREAQSKEKDLIADAKAGKLSPT